jgi:hypothetical protein
MPLITYICDKCKKKVSKSFKAKEKIPWDMECTCTEGKLKRQLGSPSSVTKITIDDGVNAKPVEIYENIVEMNEERSRNH